MRIRRSSASQTPLSEAKGRCQWCGNPVLWHTTFDEARVPLIPGALPSALIAARYRWHVLNGIAHLGEDPGDIGTCRVKHSSVCPALPHPDSDPELLPPRGQDPDKHGGPGTRPRLHPLHPPAAQRGRGR